MEENNKINIKCPNCGAKLIIKQEILNIPNVSNKLMRCPTCGETSPFGNFSIIKTQKEKTETNIKNKQEPIIKPGLIKLSGSSMTFNLVQGQNIIGRNASSSNATIKIQPENKRLSREHLVIDVHKRANGYVHMASLYKEQVNTTSINNEQLHFGDSIILNDGDIINLPDVNLTFKYH